MMVVQSLAERHAGNAAGAADAVRPLFEASLHRLEDGDNDAGIPRVPYAPQPAGLDSAAAESPSLHSLGAAVSRTLQVPPDFIRRC